MSRETKTPQAARNLRDEAAAEGLRKVCRRAPTGEDSAAHLTWRFSWIDHDGPWSLQDVPAENLRAILAKLGGWEMMTWGQIQGEDPKSQHSVEPYRLIKAARDRLGVLKLDDLDEVFRFRLTGKQRLWGVPLQNVFYLLWWDPDHKICPSGKDKKPTGNKGGPH
jgi:hypothetical protein